MADDLYPKKSRFSTIKVEVDIERWENAMKLSDFEMRSIGVVTKSTPIVGDIACSMMRELDGGRVENIIVRIPCDRLIRAIEEPR